MSLWAVSDEATLAFMKSFYQHLNDGSAGRALHLTTKCLSESEKYSKVTHWAPFVLFSDDVTLEFATEKEERRKETAQKDINIGYKDVTFTHVE